MANAVLEFSSVPANTALALGFIATLIMWAEMRWARWRPFFWVTAAFIFGVPLLISIPYPLPWASLFAWRDLPWAWVFVVFALALLWEGLIFSWLYEGWLSRQPFARRQAWSIDTATDTARALAHRISPRGESIAYAILVFVWAPFAENLFYWGFLYNALRSEWHSAWAVFWVVMLFSIRHALHFIPIRPMPFPAMIAYALSVAVPAGFNCWLFTATGSLIPLIVVHLLMNMILAGLYLRRSKA